MQERSVTVRPRRRLWQLIAGLLAIALFAAACGDDSDTNTADNGDTTTTAPSTGGDDGPAGEGAGTPAPKPLAEKTKLRVSYPVAIEGFAHLLLADHFGEFEKENLEIELTVAPGNEALVLLGSDDLDIVMGSPNAGFMNAVHAGVDVRWVGPTYEGNPESKTGLWIRNDVLGDDGEAQADEVKGMSVALGQLGFAAPSAIVVRDFLKPLGLELTDIEVSNLQGADMVIALENGGIDAAVVLDPFTQQVAAADYATFVQPFAAISTGGFLAGSIREKNPEALEAFMRAIARTVRTYLQGDYHQNDEVVNALAEIIGVEPDSIKQNESLVWNPDLVVDPKVVADFQEMWIAAGLLQYDEPKPASELIDDSAIKAALG